jgi:hypothetical protein
MNPDDIPTFSLSAEGLARLMTGQPTDQLFQSEFFGVYNAGAFIRLAVIRPQLFTRAVIELTQGMYDHLMAKHGVDERYVELADSRLHVPVAFVTVPDPEGPHLLIDGTHRIVRAYRKGLRELPAMIADETATAMVKLQ